MITTSSYYLYASFTNAQLPLLEAAALYVGKLVILDPVGVSWVTIRADHGILRRANSPPRICKQPG